MGAGDDAHDVTGEAVRSRADVAVPSGLAPDDPPPGEAPGPDELDEEVTPLKADVAAAMMPWRNGGTAASTTPRANTVTPMARAGRSMTSLQLVGRRGACRGQAGPGRADVAGRPDHAWRQYPPSCARNPAIASRIAAILDWLA